MIEKNEKLTKKDTFYKDYYLVKGKYTTNDRLYLGLEHEYGFEAITINIPDILLNENEIILDRWTEAEALEELGLFTVINIINYNMGKYKIALLNNDVLNKYAVEIEED